MIDPERFLLAPAAGGGALLLNLESGAILKLNESAAFVWRLALTGAPDAEVVSEYARAFSLAVQAAAADVRSATCLPTSQVSPGALAADPSVGFSYRHLDATYQLCLRGTPVVEVLADGSALRVLAPLTSIEARDSLYTLAPRLFALRGETVLHASAVRAPGGDVLAFCGASGAGKTTTARAFVDAGMSLVSEDKLVVRVRTTGEPTVVTGAEPQLRRWLADAAPEMTATPPGSWYRIDSQLALHTESDAAPLRRVLLLDAARRGPAADVSTVRLGVLDAAGEIFLAGLFGADTRAAWQRQVAAATAIAGSVATYAATVPVGIDALAAAVRRYTDAIRS